MISSDLSYPTTLYFFILWQLCTVTLTLFETLVGLNCEDVMLWLVFRHLIPMNYLLPSQRETLHMMPDIHGRGAQKLLSLVPICCTGMVIIAS